MLREELINETVEKLRQFPDSKIQEVLKFVNFLESTIDDRTISEAVKRYVSRLRSNKFINETEEDFY
jgi:hypothetical protein